MKHTQCGSTVSSIKVKDAHTNKTKEPIKASHITSPFLICSTFWFLSMNRQTWEKRIHRYN